ncbi:M17 family metallopeptidase [Mycoplasma nasistruthionis]|uniref:Probable cytosol aminopeptidase n=1 Tax=Mycoplasma nasistruthionis TaxID=353852 RepID=A0A4Y6I7D5_9MOLU|nr:leucyl aminopeptidase family protein [Mycoplasma nasistruthionis]QDF65240.1 leucyl aminopeptidase family protein [Mycoplasma nasistruthionis]
MKILNQAHSDFQVLKAAYQNLEFPSYVGLKNAKVTDNLVDKVSYLYIDQKHQTLDELKDLIQNFTQSADRNYLIDIASFSQIFDYSEVLRLIYSSVSFAKAKLFKKSSDKSEDKESEIGLLISEQDQKQHSQLIDKLNYLNQAITKVRDFQIKPENFLNSEMLAAQVAYDLSGIENLSITTLTKKEISELGMNLLLSVNQGSVHEPRVVVVEYNGNPESQEKISLVGKGITFDTGGVNTKGYHMEGMKYDMSGSVIVAYAVKVLAQLKAKVNVSAVMCITDNRINNDASLPENVYQSMSGKWVEVVDTDAEGRLVLADGIYYAAKELKATTIVDVATLTGAILTALGNVYTGIWSTNDEKWSSFESAAKLAQEKVWRMPLHKDYHKGNTSSKVADLANWSKQVRPDSSQAAMFLKEFTNDVDFIHCDVAGTADVNGEPQGVLVSTLVEFGLLNQNK